MKSRLFIISCSLILIILLFGCSKTDESKESNWEDLVKNVPEIVMNEKEIPEDILNQIKLPKYSTIPFEVKQVLVTPQTSFSEKGPLLIDISFIGEEDVLHVSNLFIKEDRTLAAQETVTLSNGLEAQWDEQGNAKVLSWHDSEDNVVIDLMIPTPMGEKNDYTIKEFLKMANSIE
ncbi:hypothetical protein [Psychrobacillus psychrodurans]|uniref:hypothetical protein n=1 Tax=Psychrobacillus psychrodurans TaxID=126157 RepID=UPI0008F41AF1|nr:hypothetical protein [Psychrobacillus psychrodurans]MCZ8539842.1 hypothetical protein [Psychrobacillus psychrodurans]SFM55965.1 hypothetical protein SAMN05421832_103380 [Psychrobacillus psychrodurans]